MWDIRQNNTWIIGVLEGKESKKAAENIFQDILAKNFPNMGKETDIQVQEDQKVPNKMNPKRSTPKHIIQTVPDLLWFNLWFFDFVILQNDTYWVETTLWILAFSWASDMWYYTLSWCWAVATSQGSRSAKNHMGDQLIHLQPFCTHTTIVFFTFSTVFN